LEHARRQMQGAFMIVLVLIPLFSLSFPHSARGQFILQSGLMDEMVRRGEELVYNMEFDAADRTFDSVIAVNPKFPAGYFYKAMVNFWRAVTNPDNTSYDEAYNRELQMALDRSDSLLDIDDHDVAGIFYKGAALGMHARIFAIRPKWEDAIGLILGDAREGVKYLNEIEDIMPANSDVLFGRGLYNYYVEAEKEDNPALRPLISMFATGNKRTGLLMLEQAAQYASYARTEAQYELARIYELYEHNYSRANMYAQQLTNKYPNNVQFLHLLGTSQVSLGLTAQYDSTFHVLLERSKERRPGYTIRQAREAFYYIGQAQLISPHGNLDSALGNFYNSDLLSIKMSPGETNGWMTKAELFMGEIYDLKGMRDRALQMYKRVIDMQSSGDDHNVAERYLANPYRR
jgi:tetratricopeptide (TPR) repeat protein